MMHKRRYALETEQEAKTRGLEMAKIAINKLPVLDLSEAHTSHIFTTPKNPYDGLVDKSHPIDINKLGGQAKVNLTWLNYQQGLEASRDDCERQLKLKLDREKIACCICSWNKDCDSSPTLNGIPKHDTCSVKLQEADQIIKILGVKDGN